MFTCVILRAFPYIQISMLIVAAAALFNSTRFPGNGFGWTEADGASENSRSAAIAIRRKTPAKIGKVFGLLPEVKVASIKGLSNDLNGITR